MASLADSPDQLEDTLGNLNKKLTPSFTQESALGSNRITEEDVNQCCLLDATDRDSWHVVGAVVNRVAQELSFCSSTKSTELTTVSDALPKRGSSQRQISFKSQQDAISQLPSCTENASHTMLQVKQQGSSDSGDVTGTLSPKYLEQREPTYLESQTKREIFSSQTSVSLDAFSRVDSQASAETENPTAETVKQEFYNKSRQSLSRSWASREYGNCRKPSADDEGLEKPYEVRCDQQCHLGRNKIKETLNQEVLPDDHISFETQNSMILETHDSGRHVDDPKSVNQHSIQQDFTEIVKCSCDHLLRPGLESVVKHLENEQARLNQLNTKSADEMVEQQQIRHQKQPDFSWCRSADNSSDQQTASSQLFLCNTSNKPEVQYDKNESSHPLTGLLQEDYMEEKPRVHSKAEEKQKLLVASGNESALFQLNIRNELQEVGLDPLKQQTSLHQQAAQLPTDKLNQDSKQERSDQIDKHESDGARETQDKSRYVTDECSLDSRSNENEKFSQFQMKQQESESTSNELLQKQAEHGENPQSSSPLHFLQSLSREQHVTIEDLQEKLPQCYIRLQQHQPPDDLLCEEQPLHLEQTNQVSSKSKQHQQQALKQFQSLHQHTSIELLQQQQQQQQQPQQEPQFASQSRLDELQEPPKRLHPTLDGLFDDIILEKEARMRAGDGLSEESGSKELHAGVLDPQIKMSVRRDVLLLLDTLEVIKDNDYVPDVDGAWVEARCPSRIDLYGGWTDTPPICYEMGGSVVNMSILVDGCHQISARARITGQHSVIRVVQLENAKSESVFFIESMPQLMKFDDPESQGSLVKACIAACGILKRSLSLSEQMTENFNGGLDIVTSSQLPHGSGLGTSSILASAICAAVWATTGRLFSRKCLLQVVLVVEQLLTTGGGWQDQVGGVVGGINMCFSQPTLPLKVQWESLPVPYAFQDLIEKHFVLIYTGKARLARNLLDTVLAAWHSNVPSVLDVFRQLHAGSVRMRNAVRAHDLSVIAQLLSDYSQLKKQLTAKAQCLEATDIVDVFDAIRPFCIGYSLLGAGGGGFALAITAAPNAHATLKAAIASSMTRRRGGVVDRSVQQLVVSAAWAIDGVSVHRIKLDTHGIRLFRGKLPINV